MYTHTHKDPQDGPIVILAIGEGAVVHHVDLGAAVTAA
jgi:hypothetical protein